MGRQTTAGVAALGWSKYLTRHDAKNGDVVHMPEWVCDEACRNVDASRGAAVREVAPGLWCACGSYNADDYLGEPMTYDEACAEADAHNSARGILPIVIPAHWAVIA